MMKKRILAVLFSLMLATTFLTGCNQSRPSSSEETSSNDFQVTGTAIKWGVPDIYEINYPAVQKFNQILTDRGYHFGVEFVPLNNFSSNDALYEYEEQNGSLDIAFSGFIHDQVDFAYSLIKEGYFTPLENYLATPHGKELYDIFDPQLWDAVKVDGTIYSVPNGDARDIGSTFVFNKKYVSEQDVEGFNGNIADLKSLMEKAPVQEDFTHIVYGGYNFEFSNLIASDFIDGLMLPHDGTGAYNPFELDNFREYLTVFNEYYKAGYVNYELSWKGNTISTAVNEKFLETGNFLVCIGVGGAYNPETVGTDVITVETTPYLRSRVAGTVGIAAKSEHKDEAFELLSLVHTDNELANLLIYGIEGVDYKLEDGVVHPIDGEGLKDANRSMCLGIYENVSPTAAETIIVDRKTDKLNYYKDKVVASPYLGKNFDTTGYEDIITDIYKIYEENYDI